MNAHMKFEVPVKKPAQKYEQQQQQSRSYMVPQLQVRHTGGRAETAFRGAQCQEKLEMQRAQQMQKQDLQM